MGRMDTRRVAVVVALIHFAAGAVLLGVTLGDMAANPEMIATPLQIITSPLLLLLGFPTVPVMGYLCLEEVLGVCGVNVASVSEAPLLWLLVYGLSSPLWGAVVGSVIGRRASSTRHKGNGSR